VYIPNQYVESVKNKKLFIEKIEGEDGEGVTFFGRG
jgi:hypothetical protein